jgi:TonB family protein
MVAKVIPIHRIYELPWSAADEQEERFRRLLKGCAGTVIGLALLLSFLPVPEIDQQSAPEIPPRLARLILEAETLPPPPPPVVTPEPEPEPIPEEPEAVAEVPPEPAPVAEPEPVPEPVAEPAPEPPPVDETQRARERASVAGLLPFAAELQSLRDSEATASLGRTEIGAVSAEPAAVPERSLITSSAGTRSGGIDTASLSRNTGGAGLQARATTQIDSPVEGLGTAGAAAAPQRSGESARASRSREEIERVFDRNKGAIYALYNRALRQNPSLEGKLVLRLTISPDGRVTDCEVVSSELGDPELESKLVQRVLLFQFESRDVEPVTTTKPIDFFPA